MWILIIIVAVLFPANLLGLCPTDLPPGCSCTGTSKLYLTCDMNGKTSWPKFNSELSAVLLYNVTLLGPTNIQTLTAEALQYIKCEFLYLRNLGISDVHPKAFIKSSNTLFYLNMDHNSLQSVPNSALVAIKSRSFYFDMKFNKVTYLATTWLPDNMYSLYLSNNDIHHIDPNFFHATNKIDQLDLSYNHLEDEDIEGITKLRELSYLRLSHNLLTIKSLDLLHSKVFKHITSSFTLHMDNNNLSTTPFVDDPLVIRSHGFNIRLSHNHLTDFPDIININCRSFIDINLSHNHIQRIPSVNNMCSESATGYRNGNRYTINLSNNLIYNQGLLSIVKSLRNIGRTEDAYVYDLDYNQMKTLLIQSKYTIDGAPYNTSLDLTIKASYNILRDVPVIQVSSNRTLNGFDAHVYVRNNNISTITNPDNKISVVPRITKVGVDLYADYNPIYCGCDTSWVRNSTYTTLQTSMCGAPVAFCGYYIGCYPLTGCKDINSTRTFEQFCAISPNTTCTDQAEVTQTSGIVSTTTTSTEQTQKSSSTEQTHKSSSTEQMQISSSTEQTQKSSSTEQTAHNQNQEQSQTKTILLISLPAGGGLILIILAFVIACVMCRCCKHDTPPSVPNNSTSPSGPQGKLYVNHCDNKQTKGPVYCNELFESDEHLYATIDENAYESLDAKGMKNHEKNYDVLEK